MRNVVSVVDISTMKRDETVAAINKSLLEQRMRMGSENTLRPKWMRSKLILIYKDYISKYRRWVRLSN